MQYYADKSASLMHAMYWHFLGHDIESHHIVYLLVIGWQFPVLNQKLLSHYSVDHVLAVTGCICLTHFDHMPLILGHVQQPCIMGMLGRLCDISCGSFYCGGTCAGRNTHTAMSDGPIQTCLNWSAVFMGRPYKMQSQLHCRKHERHFVVLVCLAFSRQIELQMSLMESCI